MASLHVSRAYRPRSVRLIHWEPFYDGVRETDEAVKQSGKWTERGEIV